MEGPIFVRLPCLSTNTATLRGSLRRARDLLDFYHPYQDCYVTSRGKVIDLEDNLKPEETYTICPRLRGGKGGFGSMLRAIGAQIEKTTNREACRDLSGRRMRDVNNEKKMLEYMEKKAERERERENNKKEKLERLTQKPKHFFSDPDYDTRLHEAIENVDKAVEKGIVAHVKKRKLNQNEKEKEEPKIKKGLWLGEEDISSGDSDSDEEEIAALRLGIGDHSGASTSGSSCTHRADQSGTSQNGSGMDGSNIARDAKLPKAANELLDSAESSDFTDTNQTEMCTKETGSGGETSVTEPILNEASGSGSGSVESAENGETVGTTAEDADGDSVKVTVDCSTIDLSAYNSATELEKLGLESLKTLLMKKGVKCGGSLKERAERLLIVKDLTPDQIDPGLLATKSKKRNRPRK